VANITVDWQAPTKERTMTFASDGHLVTWDDAAAPGIERDAVAVPVGAGPEPLAAVVAELLAAIDEGRPASCGPVQELPILAVLDAASRSAALDGAPLVVDLRALDVRALSGGVAR
jgi:L-ascorbate metabolism protein UlaG (beta-lactamase superfamily)